MATDDTHKQSRNERRRSVRSSQDGPQEGLSWEEKVLRRVGKHVKQPDASSSPPEEIGWEAASLEVIKQHSRTLKDDKSK